MSIEDQLAEDVLAIRRHLEAPSKPLLAAASVLAWLAAVAAIRLTLDRLPSRKPRKKARQTA